jgi:hypothetical protein
MSYQEEKKLKDAEKAKRSRKYRFEPVGYDCFDPKTTLVSGDIVVKIQPYGCPRNGTMNHCYVGDPETGNFIGLVYLASLVPA